MKNALCVLASFTLLSGAAAAQTPAPAPAPSAASRPAESPERPVLKLQLDEPVRSEPRINFGAREGKAEQRPAYTLPELGGKPSRAMERTPSEVVPKDLTPGL